MPCVCLWPSRLCFCSSDGVSNLSVQPWYVQVYVPPSAPVAAGRVTVVGVLSLDPTELEPDELSLGGVSCPKPGREMNGYCCGT